MIVRVIVSELLFGDRIIIPESFCQIDETNVGFPQSFLLTNTSGDETMKSIPCGVLEYSAQEGEVIVSNEIFNNLHLVESDLAYLEPIILPKVTELTLDIKTPMSNSLNMEQVLMNRITEKYSCVYDGQTLYFVWENVQIACQVSQLQPNKACSFVNADVSVTLNTASIQASPLHTTYQLSPDTPTFETTCNPGSHFLIEITNALSHQLVIQGPNLCCIAYLNFSENEEAYNEKVVPSSSCHKQSFFIDQERTIPIDSSVSIWIEIACGSQIQISFNSNSVKNRSGTSTHGTPCPVCYRLIPDSSFQLHVLHCQRHVRPCPICNQPIHKQQEFRHQHCPICSFITSADHMEFHHQYEHVTHQCECGAMILPCQQAQHYLNDCPKRRVCCRFCHESHFRDSSDCDSLQEFQQDPVDRFEGLTKHESVCANKTVHCSLCQEYVMSRYLLQHYHLQHHRLNHFVVCSLCGFRQNCVYSSCLKCGCRLNIEGLLRWVHCCNRMCKERCSEDNGEMCEKCFNAIYKTRQNNAKTIIGFLAQCYLKQWKVGCKSNCTNPFCKSYCGKSDLELPAVFQSCQIDGGSDSEIVARIIQLANTSFKNKQFYICPAILYSYKCLLQNALSIVFFSNELLTCCLAD